LRKVLVRLPQQAGECIGLFEHLDGADGEIVFCHAESSALKPLPNQMCERICTLPEFAAIRV